MRSAKHIALCAAALLVMLLAGSQVTRAVTCMATELAPCAPAISSSSPPSELCCSKIKEQQPCLCGYLKNPSLRGYVTSPNAKKVATTCGVPVPKC
ncbi:non-specific lipid-transfer protein 2-like [Cynara cardunculus var. scolymus]|uniref:Bifunctional inhibitor/plant lipid transfer protein/seed storage helical domain-containing protein n=1 Tax=Cynara cardunculus var. scolymus TaxID=59895 RepID=A0A103Y8U0_CYNCS|nr:non-specific lipid-transfer protein 2-like [Cynara cardunculus var. scolymus]KVI04649.1 Bifunctional inhibitor/plant lipid transfer protein/seed storage helical domain-containing protein [Cynara cardunculus var. scolymus]